MRSKHFMASATGSKKTKHGEDNGGERAATIYTLIETCKTNGIDPRAWLTDVLARLPDYPAKRSDDLLPCYWQAEGQHAVKAV